MTFATGEFLILAPGTTGHSKHPLPTKQEKTLHMDIKEAVIKTFPKKKKCKRAKWLSEEALKITEK